jgi:anti-sigma factor RsiW
MSQPSGISPQELHDYVDGRLDDAERARVACYLANHPERAAEVESYRAQVAGLHALYDSVLDEPVPTAMRDLVRGHRSKTRRQGFMAAAAVLLAAFLAGVGGWSLRGAFSGDDAALSRFVAEAEQSYRLDAGSAVASDVAVQPAGALASIIGRRLGTAVSVPAFEQAGYRLIALRFVPTARGDAATLVYQDGQGRPAALFVVRTEAHDQAPNRLVNGAIATLYRVRDGVGYAFTLPAAISDDRIVALLAGG